MVNKMITVSIELYEKLRNEDNASRLIQRLLTDHYRLDSNPEQLEAMMFKKKQEMDKLIYDMKEAKKFEGLASKRKEEKEDWKKFGKSMKD